MNKGCSTAAAHPAMLYAGSPHPRLLLPTDQKSTPRYYATPYRFNRKTDFSAVFCRSMELPLFLHYGNYSVFLFVCTLDSLIYLQFPNLSILRQHPSVSGDSRIRIAHQKKQELFDLLTEIQMNNDFPYIMRMRDRRLLQRLATHVDRRAVNPEW
jgi:hypothetical protein